MSSARTIPPVCCLAVDSDGCVFDSMRVKQESCFIPRLIETWELDAFREIVTERALHLNLYSPHRGENRFAVLLALFRELREGALAGDSPLAGLDLTPLENWVASGAPLSAQSLEAASSADDSGFLQNVLRWTRAVNRDIAALPPATPFSEAVAALHEAQHSCEIRVVSSANSEALRREWEGAGLLEVVHSLNGQEQGRKEDVLRAAAEQFGSDRTLMVGDAPADQTAAENSGVPFFLIRAGRENEDWHTLRTKNFQYAHV